MKLLHAYEKTFVMTGHSADESRKRSFLACVIILFICFLFFFAVHDFNQGQIDQGAFLSALIVVLLGVFLAIRYIDKMPRLYRFTGVVILLYLGAELAVGGAEGHAFLWFYFLPLATFYLVGKREGAIWALASWLLAALILLTPLFFDYKIEIAIRFLATYGIVSILSFGLEYSRNWYYQGLLREKQSLEAALKEVKQLQGMLPICSFCKSIRDDKGYWSQIESYIRDNSEADFSHGICPKCLKKHYPDLYQDKEDGTEPSDSG